MISQNTVLVLGAGASIPYGFPSGLDLLARMCEGRPGDWRMHGVLAGCGHDSSEIERFIGALAQSGQRSVDRFLGLRPEFAEIGKAAIVCLIGACEQTASLFAPQGEQGKWYELLFERMQSPAEHWPENRLSIVTLNYDRCYERFMSLALRNSFGWTLEQAFDAMASMRVVHPHGSLGSLDPRASNYRAFGSLTDLSQVLPAASDLRVLHEGQKDSPEFAQARRLLHEATLVFVLGLAYEQATVKRLGLNSLEPHNRPYGTAYGLERIEHEEAHMRCDGQVSLWDKTFDIRQFLRGGPIAIR